MTHFTYRIVEHDGGWAYQVDAAAAERAASEQGVSGEDRGITYQDADGRCRAEIAAGDDRPLTNVEG